MASIIPALLNVCQNEWEFFGCSIMNLDGSVQIGKREYDEGAWQRVGDYWDFLGGRYAGLNGKDRGVAWSAAFISWCMHEAGAGDRFPYSPSHNKYINKAIKNSDNNVQDAPFSGKRLPGYAFKPGDLIGYWRGDTEVTYDTARQIGWYESHTDVIVSVEPGVAYCIGGNVEHSVTRRAVQLGPNGDLTDTSKSWFVAIQNNM
ncbi:MAG: hypothetical protein AMXMBFR84_18690 [Candidatus Hydrogenedentota bacterium]